MNEPNKDFILGKDVNDQIALTQKNVEIIEGILRIDPLYRKTFDKECEESAYYYVEKNVKENKDFCNINKVKEICKRIDKENSTHLSASGNQKGSNKGVDLTAKRITEIATKKDIFNRLEKGDGHLVVEISNAVEGRNNFSFATKFCAFMCRFLFDGKEADNYSIYDNVLASILPYYAWKYLGKSEYKTKNNNSNFETEFRSAQKYNQYRCLIDGIREAAGKKNDYKLTREQFDYLLWYYYKGESKEAIQKALRTIK